MQFSNYMLGFGGRKRLGAELTVPGTPTLLLLPENYDGSTWTNTGSIGATGNFAGGVSPSKTLLDTNFNGRPTVGCDGTQYLTCAGLLSDIITNAASTIFIAARFGRINADASFSTIAGEAILIDGAGGGYMAIGTANNGVAFKNFDTDSDNISIASSTNTTYGIIATHDSGNLTLDRSGTTAATPVASGNTGDLTNSLTLGSVDASGPFFLGDIGAIVVWNSVLSAGDITSLKASALNTFNITW